MWWERPQLAGERYFFDIYRDMHVDTDRSFSVCLGLGQELLLSCSERQYRKIPALLSHPRVWQIIGYNCAWVMQKKKLKEA